jgi:hypothetical protein
MKTALALLLAAAAAAAPAPAAAGPFNDTLAVCLVKSTSDRDKTLLMRWVFAAMANHPQVRDMGHVSAEEGEKLNADVAALFWALVSDRCRAETRDAVQYEGTDAISSSFGVLGRVAMQGLMTDAGVNAYMGQMASHLDEKKMKALFAPPAATPPATKP